MADEPHHHLFPRFKETFYTRLRQARATKHPTPKGLGRQAGVAFARDRAEPEAFDRLHNFVRARVDPEETLSRSARALAVAPAKNLALNASQTETITRTNPVRLARIAESAPFTDRPRRYGEHMKEFILKSQLARRMNVHHSTIARAVQKGQIKTVPYLGRQVIPLDEARRLLEPLGISADGMDK